MVTKFRQFASKLTMAFGALTALLGVAVILTPSFVQIGGEPIMATLLILSAVLMGIAVVMAERADVRTYVGLIGLVSLVAGIIILIHPLDTSMTLATLLGFFFMLEGALFCGLATHVRGHMDVARIVYGLGGVSLVMSLLIWVRLAGAPPQTLFWMLGVAFITRGCFYVFLGRWALHHPALQPDKPKRAGEPAAA